MCEVAETLNISLGFIHNVVSCHQWFGQVTNPYTPGPHGQPRVLNTINSLFLQEVIKTDPSTYLDELQHKLAIACGVCVSIAMISHTLSRLGLTQKTISRNLSEQNDSVQVL